MKNQQNYANAEKPFYQLYKHAKKAYITSMSLMLVLSIVFFFGIWVNLILIDAGEQTKSIVLSITAVILLSLTLVQTVLSYKKARHYPYNFYRNRIEHKDKTVYYGNVDNVYARKSIFDKIFNTGTVVLHPYMKIKSISNPDYFADYILKLVQREKQQYY